MKKLLIIAIALSLTACNATIPSYVIKASEAKCSASGGVHEIVSSGFGEYGVTCEDGSFMWVKRKGM